MVTEAGCTVHNTHDVLLLQLRMLWETGVYEDQYGLVADQALHIAASH